jgi:hypothetical protein
MGGKPMQTLVAKIYSETNTRLFELCTFNRDVDKIKLLTELMKQHGWLVSHPLRVKVNGSGKYVILDGHHRFEVARALGISIVYVIVHDDATIYELNASMNPWAIQDYLISHCRSRNPDYLQLAEYCADTGIGVINAASMMLGNSAGSTGHMKGFKQGEFKVVSMDHARTVATLVAHCKKKGIKWADTHNLVLAFSKIVWVQEFSAKRFMAKITSFPYLLEKQPSKEKYLELIEKIYNFKATEKIALKFLSDEAARSRAVA